LRKLPAPTTDRLVFIVRLGLLISLAFPFLTGCARRQPDPVVHLTWWIPYAEDSAQYPAFQTLAEIYTERTGTVIDLVSVPWDDMAPRGVASKLALALQASLESGGRSPDLWGPVPSTWIGPYATEGQVLALEAEQIQNSGQYETVAMLAARWAGQQYALPVLMDSIALIYNRELVPHPPESFEELAAIARELTDGENERWGLVLPLLSQYHAYPFMDGYGGYIFKCEVSVSEGQKCDVSDIGLNNEGSVRGIEFLSDLYLGSLTGTRLPETLADRAHMHDDALNLFIEGKAGMLIDGSWAIPQIRAAGIEYGVSAIPELPEGTRSPRALTTVYVLGASAGSAHPAEAIDLMNYLAGPEAIIALQNALGKAPVRRDVMRQPALREDRELDIWYDQAANGVLLPQAPELGYVWAPWARALDETVPGLRPAQEALDQAVEQIRGHLEPE
jgi:arabinogalactan oligomer/maltooligosaccharide transport system substrate-binding protein